MAEKYKVEHNYQGVWSLAYSGTKDKCKEWLRKYGNRKDYRIRKFDKYDKAPF